MFEIREINPGSSKYYFAESFGRTPWRECKSRSSPAASASVYNAPVPPTNSTVLTGRQKYVSKPRLRDRAYACARARHLSLDTERAYSGWIKRFILLVLHGRDLRGDSVGESVKRRTADPKPAVIH